MSTSKGRRSARYLAARQAILGQPCWQCHTPTARHGPNATRADHHPPLGRIPEHIWWANGGRILPHCPTCSNRQGATLANQRNTPSRPPAP